MPRSKLPGTVNPPRVQPFHFDDIARKRLAERLGVSTLPPATEDVLGYAVAAYRATEGGSPTTTMGTLRRLLRQLLKKRTTQAYKAALEVLVHPNSAVDDVTAAHCQIAFNCDPHFASNNDPSQVKEWAYPCSA